MRQTGDYACWRMPDYPDKAAVRAWKILWASGDQPVWYHARWLFAIYGITAPLPVISTTMFDPPPTVEPYGVP